MSSPDSILWRDSFRVRFFDTDPAGYASLPALCRFLEEAADSHCRPLGLSVTGLAAQGRMWVLTRLALTFTAPPRLGDDIVVETWGSKRLGGFRAYRDFRVFDAAGRTIGEAESLWLILDAATRRPLRLPESIFVFRHPERQTPRPVDAVKLEPPAREEFQAAFRVGWRDLDPNQHANNVRYVEWMIESLPEPVHTDAVPLSLDIQFAAEALRGQDVVSVSEACGGGAFRHSLRSSGGSLLALAATRWRLDAASAGAPASPDKLGGK